MRFDVLALVALIFALAYCSFTALDKIKAQAETAEAALTEEGFVPVSLEAVLFRNSLCPTNFYREFRFIAVKDNSIREGSVCLSSTRNTIMETLQ